LNAKLIVVGTGSLQYFVQDFIRKHSLYDRVIFLGSIDKNKLYSLYANALAVIIPSIWPENAPLVALEAISVGTPVIASNMGGLPEIVEKIDKKLIFNDFNELGNILINFDNKRFPPSQIKKIFNENFTPEKYVNRYLKLLTLINHD
jgi:glycosyltransferase involved in cell wall biosynthesis